MEQRAKNISKTTEKPPLPQRRSDAEKSGWSEKKGL